MRYNLSQDSVTLYLPSGAKTFYQGSVQYTAVRNALLTNASDDEISALVEPLGALTKQLYGTGFLVSVDGKVTYNNYAVPDSIVERMNQLVVEGKSVASIANFFKRLDKNPSNRSREQLFNFIKHLDIQIEEDGTFLAYKGIREDGLDRHSGTIDNTPGKTITMPRNQISDDPDQTCHHGLHVGAARYALDFAPRHVICRVDPEHVVCVPSDYNGEKMRVCEYYVVGEYNGTKLVADDVGLTQEELDYYEDADEDYEDADEDFEDDLDEDEEFDALTRGDLKPGTVFCYGITSDPKPYFAADNVTFPGSPAVIYKENEPSPDARVTVFWSPPEDVVKPKMSQLTFTVTTDEVVHPLDEKRKRLELMKCLMDELREYASKSLKILNVSHMGGGKSTLVEKIMQTRRRLGR